VCVGIAPTKTLAKLSNHVAKKRPNIKACLIFPVKRRRTGSIAGQHRSRGSLGHWPSPGGTAGATRIMTVKDLRDAEPKTLRREFSVVVERTVLELRGVSCLDLEEITLQKKEIISSRSFGQLVTDLGELRQAVASYTARAAEKLRRQHGVASALQVFLQTNPHQEGEPQYHPGIVVPLVEPTDDTRLLASQACAAGKNLQARPPLPEGRGDADGAGRSQTAQLDLFSRSSERAAGKSKHLMQALDQINAKLGRGTLRLAAEGHGKPGRSARTIPRHATPRAGRNCHRLRKMNVRGLPECGQGGKER